MSTDVIESLSPCRQTDERPDFLPVSPKHSPPLSRRTLSGTNGVTSSGCGQFSSDSPSSGGLDQEGDVSNDSDGTEKEEENGTTLSSGPRTDEAGEGCGGDITDGSGSNGSAGVGKFPTNDVMGFASAPPPKNGIFRMHYKRKLQTLLKVIAAKDAFYSGIQEETPTSQPSSGDWSSGEGPSSFPPFEGTPTSQPPSLKTATSLDSPFNQLCNMVSKDGKTSNQEASSQKRGVWTLNLLDGNLFLFKTDPKSDSDSETGTDGSPSPSPSPREGGEGGEGREGGEVGEGGEGEGEEEGEGEKEGLVEGIELSKLLAKTPQSPTPDGQYYFHLPSTVMYAQRQDPHVSPVYTYPEGSKYRLYRRHDSKNMTPTEFILHHNTVVLVLQETGKGPIINAVQQDEMIARLKKLTEEGKSFPDASFNPVVNIKRVNGKVNSQTNPNNVAIYFTGKDNKYRYYVHVRKDGKLEPVREELPVKQVDDWLNHLEFSYLYFTPFMVDGSGSDTIDHNEQESLHGNDGEPRLRKHGVSGASLATATNAHIHESVANGRDH